MKWLACIVVLLMATSAMAEMTAVANWDNGPTVSEDWDPTDPAADATYPAWSVESGFDWIITGDGPATAVSGWPWVTPRRYPNADGVGKWGGALRDDDGVDDPEDGNLYVTINSGLEPGDPLRALVDAQGTFEFWFKPMWDPDPVLETDQHNLVALNLSSAAHDGLFMNWEGDGTMRSNFSTQALIDIGHTWTSTSLIWDWNHIAFVWDDTGNYTYCNGVKVGETIYGGPAPAKVDWGNHMYCELGMDGQSTIEYQTDGEWDSMAVWDEVRYTGPDYTVPTEPFEHVELMGDRNEDGWVGQADLDIVLAMWGNSGGDITDLRADVNEDDFVGQTDLDYVLADWGQGTPPEAPVPEPATMCLLGIGGALLLKRRR